MFTFLNWSLVVINYSQAYFHYHFHYLYHHFLCFLYYYFIFVFIANFIVICIIVFIATFMICVSINVHIIQLVFFEVLVTFLVPAFSKNCIRHVFKVRGNTLLYKDNIFSFMMNSSESTSGIKCLIEFSIISWNHEFSCPISSPKFLPYLFFGSNTLQMQLSMEMQKLS